MLHTRSKQRILSATRRPVIMLLLVLLLLLVVYVPAHIVFPASDDVFIYEDYARGVLAPPHELPREYPALSVAIFVLPYLFALAPYLAGFMLLAALATWLTLLLLDRLGGTSWLLLWYLALAAWGTLFFRFDIFVVACTVGAFFAATRQRWLLAQTLLAIGVALKLYPLILMPLVVLWQWRTDRRLPWRTVCGSAIVLLLAVGSMWWASPAQFTTMLAYHRQRPLEIESLGASGAWLLGPVTFGVSFGSANIMSAFSSTIITLLNGAGAVLLLALYWCFFRGRFAPAAAWALVLLVAIATSKVFSTQYIVWVLPFVVLAMSSAHDAQQRVWGKRFARLWTGVCLLTSVIYPVGLVLLDYQAVMVLVTLRNALWVAACVLALRWWLVPTPRASMEQPAVELA